MAAKVNLFLAVGPARRDGYHDVTTVYQAVGLYDEVTVTPARRLTVDVAGAEADGVPGGADNLAFRAVQALAAVTGHGTGVRVVIRKAIPAAAGLAGGSADAAAALVGCDALWGTGLARDVLHRLAAGLGADVPFGLHGGTALGGGRGDRLSPVLVRGEYPWVLAFADGGLATPAVYAELDRLRAGPDPVPVAAGRPDGVLAALGAGDLVALGRALGNDLQPAALRLRPQLRRLLDTGRELGAVGGVVCGSGPTVALLARSGADAVGLAAALAGTGLARAVRRATGPVAGARLLPAEGS